MSQCAFGKLKGKKYNGRNYYGARNKLTCCKKKQFLISKREFNGLLNQMTENNSLKFNSNACEKLREAAEEYLINFFKDVSKNGSKNMQSIREIRNDYISNSKTENVFEVETVRDDVSETFSNLSVDSLSERIII